MGLKVIVDVDTGVDDAAALLLLLSHRDVEVLAVTCVKGNVDVDKVCINTLRVLRVTGRTDIPVYRGAESALLDSKKDAGEFHGVDGLGNTTWSEAESVDVSDIRSEHAVMAIIRLVRQFPGEITLIPLGPLTNIALALRLEPSLGDNLKEVFIMGGNIEGKGRVTTSAEHNFYYDSEAAYIALSDLHHVNIVPYEVCLNTEVPWVWRIMTRGNITVNSEFNFHIDPEAASLCLASCSAPISIVPWEVCLDTQDRIPLSVYEEWIQIKSQKADFFKKITKHSVDRLRERNVKGFRSCDLFAMVTVLDRSSILEAQKFFATVELNGHWTRGQMIIDWTNKHENEATVNIIKKICTDKVVKLFSEALKD